MIGVREGSMFVLEKPVERLDELVGQARAAREAGEPFFQVFAASGHPRSDAWEHDYEAAHVIELVEAEGWILENIGEVRGDEDDQYAFRADASGYKVVGAIHLPASLDDPVAHN
jgi:hypothetical protein